jgi:hypothetical protein
MPRHLDCWKNTHDWKLICIITRILSIDTENYDIITRILLENYDIVT